MSFTSTIDVPQFLAQDVCRGAAVSLSTLKNWTSRGETPIIAMGEDDIPAGASGRASRFTLRRIIHIAIVAALVELGVPVKTATLAAARFTNAGEKSRGPCEHWIEGETYMTVLANGEARLWNIRSAEDFWKMKQYVDSRTRTKMAPGCRYVDITEIDFLVRARLGLDRDVPRTNLNKE